MTLTSLNQYGNHFQIKVLSSLLTHKEFLINIHDILSEEYFDNQAQQWVIKEILKYYDKYHTTPSMEILKVELQKIENEVLKLSVKEQLKAAESTFDNDLLNVEIEPIADPAFETEKVNEVVDEEVIAPAITTIEKLVRFKI